MRRFVYAINKLPHAEVPAASGRLEARSALMQAQSAENQSTLSLRAGAKQSSQ
jgi:hypothetical protein